MPGTWHLVTLREVPQQPPGRGEGIAPDFRMGVSEHDGQQSCGACSQAVPHDDKPIFLEDKSTVSKG